MSDVVVGLLAAAVGLLLCVRGHEALRALLAAWGALVGLGLGGTLVDRWTGDGFLTTALGWMLGVVLAVLLALIAYLYYAVSVVLAMGSMGFVLGATLASALGAEHTWLLTIAGLAGGIALAVLAILADVPALLLVVLSAATGASAVIGGLMLVFGSTTLDEISEGTLTADDHEGWFIAWPVVFVIAVVIQLTHLAEIRRATVRESWLSR